MNGLCPKFYGGRLEGLYKLCGKDVRPMPLEGIGAVLGSVFQDPRSQFFAKCVRDDMEFINLAAGSIVYMRDGKVQYHNKIEYGRKGQTPDMPAP
jgi:energy-coupling factor transporter ATP-binding protein EcfA2